MSWSLDFRSIILRGQDFFFFFNITKKFVVGSRKCLIQGGRDFCKYFYTTFYIAKQMLSGEFFFSVSQQIKVNGVTLDEYILPYHFIIMIPN